MSEQEQVPNFLTNLSVRNFKCFDNFNINDLGKFNIITGDNNIGKTSLLEIISTKEDNISDFLYRIYNYYKWKNSDNITLPYPRSLVKLYERYVHDIEASNRIDIIRNSTSNSIYFKNNHELNEAETRLISPNNVRINSKTGFFFLENNGVLTQGLSDIDSLQVDNTYIPFVPVNLGYNNDLVDFLSEQTNLNYDYKGELIKTLKLFLPDIEDIDIGVVDDVSGKITIVRIKLKGEKALIPLYMFGEGTIKLFRVLSEISVSKNSFISLDEIDTGIFYKKFTEYWKAILKAAFSNNVQLFITTHSKECLDYLIEAMEELGKEYQKEMRYVNMYRNKENKIVSTTFKYNEFRQALENENEIR